MGALLRAERERRGLSIEDVSAHLKISVRKLRALEDGDASAMPHPAYVKGFVRSYATYLGMATSEVVEAMQVVSSHMPETAEENVRPVRPAPAPSSSGKSGGSAFGRLLLLAVAVAALAGGSYAVWKSGFLDVLHNRQGDVVRPSLPMQDEARPAYVPAPAPAESGNIASPCGSPGSSRSRGFHNALRSCRARPGDARRDSGRSGNAGRACSAAAAPEKVLVRTGDAEPVAATPPAQEEDVHSPGTAQGRHYSHGNLLDSLHGRPYRYPAVLSGQGRHLCSDLLSAAGSQAGQRGAGYASAITARTFPLAHVPDRSAISFSPPKE